ncbi:MAG TPA: DUF4236 domain-containing protein [Candidatus Saccharimonadales bacterium]|nr:DUF4236 domain-containing protein [Candidatus Saccharimonadales bacterium]
MSLRYRRSIRLAKGVKLNLTKTGVGMTVGGKGAHYSVHSSGRRTASVGMPGTGLYYQKRTSSKSRDAVTPRTTTAPQPSVHATPAQQKQANAIGSTDDALKVTSDSYALFRTQLTTLLEWRKVKRAEVTEAKSQLKTLTAHYNRRRAMVLKRFYVDAEAAMNQQAEVVASLEQELNEKSMSLSFANSPQFASTWTDCVTTFNELMGSERVWDITYSTAVNKFKDRSVANNSFNRTLIQETPEPLAYINSDVDCLALPGANNSSIYIYPTFLLIFRSYHEFGIFDLKEVRPGIHLTKFIESEGVPKDTVVVGQTWYKTNKDGTKDKRFNGNYQIPIVQYGELLFESAKGLQEFYMFSNIKAFASFSKALAAHYQVIAKTKTQATAIRS